MLDPAAGRGEFIRAVPASERWAIDIVDHEAEGWSPDIRRIVGDARRCELPDRYFDGILVSNFLEHFTSQEDIGAFLRGMVRTLKPGGRIAVLGPNFRYCAREYFDCADHTLALTHVAVSEHLYAAGFEIERVIPRFLPFSFRSRTPRAPWMVRAYLGIPARVAPRRAPVPPHRRRRAVRLSPSATASRVARDREVQSCGSSPST